MPELVTFLDSFDHMGPGPAAAKYRFFRGGYDLVPGPFHGQAARFPGERNEVGPGLYGATSWRVGAFSANIRVGAGSWDAPFPDNPPPDLPFLATCWATNDGVYPLHWLCVNELGKLTVRTFIGPPVPPGGPPNEQSIAGSEPGALPLGGWHAFEYRVRMGRTPGVGLGSCEVRVDGVLVLAESGLDNTDPNRLGLEADHFRFGNLARWPQDYDPEDESPGGFDGVAVSPGSEAVNVDFDDVCQRMETQVTADAPMLPWRHAPGQPPHRVVCLRPTGPGRVTEFGVTGAAANWAACAEVPPDENGSYVTKPAGGDALDLYACEAAPAFAEGAPGAALLVCGTARSPLATPAATVRVRSGSGLETIGRRFLRSTEYRCVNAALPTELPLLETLTNAEVAGLQIGWGREGSVANADVYLGTQVVAELWYTPGAAPPLPGAGRGFAFWWP